MTLAKKETSLSRLSYYPLNNLLFSFGEKSKQKRTFPLSNRYSRNIDLTFRLIAANADLMFSATAGVLRFLPVQKSNQKSTPLKKKGWLGQDYTNVCFADFDH